MNTAEPEDSGPEWAKPGPILTVGSGLFLLLSFFIPQPWPAYISIACGAVPASASALEAIRRRELDINVLMILAAVGSVALGLPREAAVLLFLFALSAAMEDFALGRTKSAIASLVRLRPKTALLVEEGGDREAPVESIAAGTLVRVLAFQNVPLDGTVTEGATSVNESAMTGESRAVSKQVGDAVMAGTQNLEGAIVIRTDTTAGQTSLDRIVNMVREAQENKASGERISAWFGTRYTVFVVAVFVVSLSLRLIFGQAMDRALYASLTVFVALSPCALVIASPAASLSALAAAARRGILVRGGEALEAAGQATAIALDKTGTLTEGRPQLVKICACVELEGGVCKDDDGCWHGVGEMPSGAARLLAMAAALERLSTHPLAAAIVQASDKNGSPSMPVEGATVVPGMGLEGTVDGVFVQVGQRKFFEGEGRQLPDAFLQHVIEHQEEGCTVAIVKAGPDMAALALRDEPRPEAKAVIDELKALGLDPVAMVTGDSAPTAKAVAEEVGIQEVRAAQLPADKLSALKAWEKAGKKVIMVGDGVNDAPALAAAHLGIAMGGLGSDAALEAADVALVRDRLTAIPELVRLGRRMTSLIKGSLFFAGGMVVVLFVGALLADAFLDAEARKAILPLAVVGHEGSTVLVILNGLRLLGWKGN